LLRSIQKLLELPQGLTMTWEITFIVGVVVRARLLVPDPLKLDRAYVTNGAAIVILIAIDPRITDLIEACAVACDFATRIYQRTVGEQRIMCLTGCPIIHKGAKPYIDIEQVAERVASDGLERAAAAAAKGVVTQAHQHAGAIGAVLRDHCIS